MAFGGADGKVRRQDNKEIGMVVLSGILVAASILVTFAIGLVIGFFIACWGWMDKLKAEDFVDGHWVRRKSKDG